MPNCWLLQADPDRYDLDAALQEGEVSLWRVPRHAGAIDAGDRIVIWRSGLDAGVIGGGTVVEASNETGLPAPALQTYTNIDVVEDGLPAMLVVLRLRPIRFVSRVSLAGDPALRSHPIFLSPLETVFPVDPDQWSALERLAPALEGLEPAGAVGSHERSRWSLSELGGAILDRFRGGSSGHGKVVDAEPPETAPEVADEAIEEATEPAPIEEPEVEAVEEPEAETLEQPDVEAIEEPEAEAVEEPEVEAVEEPEVEAVEEPEVEVPEEPEVEAVEEPEAEAVEDPEVEAIEEPEAEAVEEPEPHPVSQPGTVPVSTDDVPRRLGERLRVAVDMHDRVALEGAAADAFAFLGFWTSLVGEPGSVAVYLSADLSAEESYTVLVTCAPGAGEAVEESDVDWTTLEELQKEHEADHLAVLAPEFDGEAIRERAGDPASRVLLLDTETLNSLIVRHACVPADLAVFRGLLRGESHEDVMSRLRDRAVEAERRLRLTARILQVVADNAPDEGALSARDLYWLLREYGEELGDYTEDEIEETVETLASPALGALRVTDQGCVALGSAAAAGRRLGFISRVARGEPEGPGPVE